MRKTLSIIILVSLFASVQAVPAYNGKRTATQPDGTKIEYFVHGDEAYHFMADSEGNMLERGQDGFLRKAGKTPTKEQIRARRAASQIQHVTSRKVGSSTLISKGLVILVNFSDVKFQPENTPAAFDEMLNGANYTYNGATGSVRRYYADQSDSAFVPSFDVYGPVTVSNTAEWYGQYQSRIGRMVKEAVIAAKDSFKIDFSKYDADEDGYVDFVDILYAGYGSADSDYENTVWPCEWTLRGAGQTVVTYDGKNIDTFSCHQELCGFGTSKGKRAGIGTPCHEFGHVFGLPDMYDTGYQNATVGEWDLMDQGSYNNESRTPPGFSGYERIFAGWVTPRLLNEPENVKLKELQTEKEVLLLTATGNHNLDIQNPSPATFYLLENRQQTSWDKYLPGHGMLIWKIQYNASRWENNTVNNAAVSKQGITILSADDDIYHEVHDGYVYSYGDAGDSYPGKDNVTAFEAVPTYPITDITENAGVIYFKLKDGVKETFTVSFEAGEHGTCSTKSVQETEAGAGILLPAVTANEGYRFVGWSTSSNSSTADAGNTGETYYPSYDITLYAVYKSTTYNIEWDAEHATITQVSKPGSENLVLTIVPDEGYTVTIDDIAITMDDRELVARSDFFFSKITLVIPLVSGDVYILVIAQKAEDTPQSTEELSYNDLFETAEPGKALIFKADADINIYDISGRLACSKHVRKGDALQLTVGVYMLQTADKKHYKLMIR